MKKKTKVIISIFVVLFLIIGLVVGIIVYGLSSLSLTDDFLDGKICNNSDTCDTYTFIIEPGSTGKDTLNQLYAEGIIKDSSIVYYYNRIFTGYSFVAGSFDIPRKMEDMYGNVHETTLDELLDYLSKEENANLSTFTMKFDEGDFIKHFARLIAQEIDVTEQEILDTWNSESYVRSLMADYDFLTEDVFNLNVKYYLEGYLFPDTYEFYRNASIDDITRKMLDRTQEIYEKYITEFDSSDLSIHEVFTLASIVQWESGDEEDSKLVAGVFINRLNAPEVLASTVTACYASDLTKDECDEIGDTLDITQKYDPYNTYTVQGLPPGPVCCPNEVAIKAALNPDTEDGYFYFVANMCDGGTVFAKTWEEHNRNIDRYYLACDD